MSTRHLIGRDPADAAADELRAWLDARIPAQPAPWEAVPTSHRSLTAIERVDRSEARCDCRGGSFYACPRHDPAGYADAYARHATDSFGPFAVGVR
jgi:hypothetical protein